MSVAKVSALLAVSFILFMSCTKEVEILRLIEEEKGIIENTVSGSDIDETRNDTTAEKEERTENGAGLGVNSWDGIYIGAGIG